MRAAIYNRFWHSMGGGERHSGMIAVLLAQAGAEIDLVGHSKVSLAELGDRLALDLAQVRLRVVPDRGEDGMSEVSADYDLFINATYMSRVASKAVKSAYLCFFPTPFDHDLNAMHRAALKRIGPHLGSTETKSGFYYGPGWYPAEGGRRRHWAWSNGDGHLTFGPGPALDFEADFGRPGAPVSTLLTIHAGEGRPAVIEVVPTFTRHRIRVPRSDRSRELRLMSQTFSPGQNDPRELGIAMSRPRVLGSGLSARQRIARRYPWLLRRPDDLSFLASYDVVLANSAYTQSWIETLWHTPAKILYPPIEVSGIDPKPDRQPVILSVGRFFAPGHGHSKRQLEMVRIFGDLVRSRQLPDWRFVVVGGCEEGQREYLKAVRAAADGLPVDIHANAPRSLVESLMSSASIFWSATGMRENTEKRPWTNEHFGMTTAEAMVGGCVPVVIDRAGQREIVRDGIDGFRWHSPEQLRIRTVQVATDPGLRERLAASAMQRVQQFSDEAFAERWWELAAKHDLMGAVTTSCQVDSPSPRLPGRDHQGVPSVIDRSGS